VEDNIHGETLKNDNEDDEKVDWDKLVDAGLVFDPPIPAAASSKPGDAPVGLAPILEKSPDEPFPDIEKTMLVARKPVIQQPVQQTEAPSDTAEGISFQEMITVEKQIDLALGDEVGLNKSDRKGKKQPGETTRSSSGLIITVAVIAIACCTFYLYHRNSAPAIKPEPGPAMTRPFETRTHTETEKTLPPSSPVETLPAPPAVRPEAAVPAVTPSVNQPPAPAVTPPVKQATVPAKDIKTPTPAVATPAKQTAAPAKEVKTPPPAVETPAKKALSTVEPEHYSYTVHVSSYKDAARAAAAVTQLKKEGHAAFAGLVQIPEMGKWYRVYAGYIKSPDEARTLASEIKDISKEDVEVVKTPMAIQIGETSSLKDLTALHTSLKKKGYFVYIVPVSKGSQDVRILAGAFKSESEATLMMSEFKKDGFAVKVVRR
jgi:cell division septation protein DedD